MNKKRLMGLLGVLAFCLMCLWAVGENARAAEQGETAKKKFSCDAAMRKHFKNWGIYLGKSSHCYYTYARNIYGNRKNGVVIVGFQETVKEIRIPEKIKGKKVIAIHLVRPDAISGDSHAEALSMKAKSKTKSIVVPRYVNDISDDSLGQGYFLTKLNNFKVSSKNRHFSSKFGVLFTKDKNRLLRYPDNRKAAKYRVPNGVTEIFDDSFGYADVERIIMPDSVRAIGASAFCGASIKKISLSKNLKRIGINAFLGSKIKKISLPKNLKYIGHSAFEDTELREIVIPGKVKEISYCFASCKKLEKVTIGKGVEEIGEGAFVRCGSLKKITIPSSVRKIGEGAFIKCYQLKEINIPSSVKKFDDPFTYTYDWTEYEDGSDYALLDQEAWRGAGLTLYVKKGSYVERKLRKNTWKEKLAKLGIKVKIV